jgi:hypothetical protein
MPNCNFKKSIWSNQKLNCINIEVWWVIRNLIEEFQKQGPKQKGRVNIGFKIDQIKGQIEENWKVDSHLRVKMDKSETKGQDEKDIELWGW